MATKKKYSKAASKKIAKVMREKKRGKLRSGSGQKVTSRKQAIAIGISEARKEGKKVPAKKTSKKKASKKKASKKTSKKKTRTKATKAAKTSKKKRTKSSKKKKRS